MKEEFKTIANRLKKRDFRGYTGSTIKNSVYQFLISLVGKVGGLLFTILIARILLPEMFGLYSLAISTIFIFMGIADLGIEAALIRFVSKNLARNLKRKAKGYFNYLLFLKGGLVAVLSIILLLSFNPIASGYYQKPIGLALLVGIIYLFSLGLITFLQALLQTLNMFKEIFYKEVFSQIIRFVVVPIFSIFILQKSLTQDISLFWIVLSTALVYLFSLIFLIILVKNKIELFDIKGKKINKNEKKTVNLFMLPLSATVLTDMFFGNIDMVMLGRFVSPSFISYYKAAFTFVLSVVPLLAFSTVLFPVFSRLKGKRLNEGMKKSLSVVLPLSFIMGILTFLFSSQIINIVFGPEYIAAAPILRLFSLLLLSLPVTQIYHSYTLAKGDSKTIMWLLIFSTLLNIILNYVLIIHFIKVSEMMAVFGVTMATIITRYIFLGGLILKNHKSLSHKAT